MSRKLNAPDPAVPVIDESRLISEFGDDAEILNELKDMFLQHVPPLFESIREAVTRDDAETVARDAHSLKGACSTFGAPRLAAVCLEFELAGKAGDLSVPVENLDLLQAEYDAVFESLGAVGAPR